MSTAAAMATSEPVEVQATVADPKDKNERGKTLRSVSLSRFSDGTRQRILDRAKGFRLKDRYYHEVHGVGVVDAVSEDGTITMTFDSGDAHVYAPKSQGKLKPVLNQPETFSAAALFKVCDTDSSGMIDVDEFTFLHVRAPT